MSSRDEEQGPKFIWNFPLVTRVQTRGGIATFALKRLSRRREQILGNNGSDETASQESEEGVLESIENSIDDLSSQEDTSGSYSESDVDTEPRYEQKRSMSQAVEQKKSMDTGFENDS
jgi:hypothetical protein